MPSELAGDNVAMVSKLVGENNKVLHKEKDALLVRAGEAETKIASTSQVGEATKARLAGAAKLKATGIQREETTLKALQKGKKAWKARAGGQGEARVGEATHTGVGGNWCVPPAFVRSHQALIDDESEEVIVAATAPKGNSYPSGEWHHPKTKKKDDAELGESVFSSKKKKADLNLDPKARLRLGAKVRVGCDKGAKQKQKKDPAASECKKVHGRFLLVPALNMYAINCQATVKPPPLFTMKSQCKTSKPHAACRVEWHQPAGTQLVTRFKAFRASNMGGAKQGTADPVKAKTKAKADPVKAKAKAKADPAKATATTASVTSKAKSLRTSKKPAGKKVAAKEEDELGESARIDKSGGSAAAAAKAAVSQAYKATAKANKSSQAAEKFGEILQAKAVTASKAQAKKQDEAALSKVGEATHTAKAVTAS